MLAVEEDRRWWSRRVQGGAGPGVELGEGESLGDMGRDNAWAAEW